jgi:KaiC/GvpD/RAD55 family RecA-like ATPase
MHEYRLGIDELDADIGTVKGGTSILVAGPPLSGKAAAIYALAKQGLIDGEGVILIPTMETADNVLSAIGRRNVKTEKLMIIDCMSRPLGLDVEETRGIAPVNGPMDLTGMGVRAGRLMEEWRGRPVRLIIDSLSTLLMYSSLPAVFRFVHLLNGRVRASGSLGVGGIEEGMHDERTMAAFRQLYSAAIEIKETGNSCLVRAVGLTPRPTPWHELGQEGMSNE